MQRCVSFQAVEDWLRCLGLLHYAQSFYDNGYEDLETVKKIKEKDLDAIGMKNESDREDILRAVTDLYQNVYFELRPDGEEDSLFRSKIEGLQLKEMLMKCVQKDNIRLRDITVTDLFPIAIRYASELSTVFDDVRDMLEVMRNEEEEIPKPTTSSSRKHDSPKTTNKVMEQLRTEVLLQRAKKKYGKHAGNTIYTKIMNKEIPAKVLYEDEQCIVFNDAEPQATVHFLVFPRLPIPCLSEAKNDDIQLLGHLMYVASQCACEQGLEKNGYKVVVNNKGTGDESGVRHLHLHVIGDG